jgi:CubicO group peptidase (beta-lactamase class C family)
LLFVKLFSLGLTRTRWTISSGGNEALSDPRPFLAVLKSRKILKSKGYGFANIEVKAQRPRKPFTNWRPSRSALARAIMLLLEDGKLELAERAAARLPSPPMAWSNVTVRHFLTHTSGMKNYVHLETIVLHP